MKILQSHKTFEGFTQFFSHDSVETKTQMKFAAFIPPGKLQGCIIWLSGLTCNEENFISKAASQKFLAAHQLMLIAPDTSPRGLNLPEEHLAYDFGSGAGFYVDATVSPYNKHYRMYSYIVNELYSLIIDEFKIQKISIMGHSMGGHGALIMALREPSKFKAVSAFAPIVNPIHAPWGEKAFRGYLGECQASWLAYDAVELLRSGKKFPEKILIHQGTADQFLQNQLLTQKLIDICTEQKQPCEVVMAYGYDHSYYFIATFIEVHLQHHALYLL